MVDIHVDEALLTFIAGALSFIAGVVTKGVKYLFNLQVSVKELNMKIVPVIDSMNQFRDTIKILDSSLNNINYRVKVIETICDKGDSKWQ